MKKLCFILLTILCSSGMFSQACSCFIIVDSADVADGNFQIAHMVLGTDTGVPPGYHCDNCSSPLISLPFNFCFYGQDYNSLYIDSKGCVTFTQPEFSYSSTGFPKGRDTVLLAPFYADISDTPQYSSTLNFSFIYYKITPTHMIIQWNTVGYATFDDDLYNDFQLIITNGADSILPLGNNVSFCYDEMQWASGDSSGGSAGFAGAPAIVGANKGDGIHFAQIGAFDFPGYAYDGPFDTNSGVYWLNAKSLTFNTCVTNNIIPPVIVNPDSCSNFTVCVGDTLLFNAFFICPQQGQSARLTDSAPGLTGLVTATNRIDSLYHITGRLIATLSDTGTHIVWLTATDNSTPPLSNSRLITITVKNCNDTGMGINKLTKDNPPLLIYPNPNNGKFTIQLSVPAWMNPARKNLSGWRSDGVSAQSSVEIYNMLGQKVYSQSNLHNSSFTIDMSSQPAGMYFYRVLSENYSLLGEGKFVIQ